MPMKLALFITLVAFLILPARAKAIPVDLPFAGIASISIPCTCSGTLAVWLIPLYLGGPVMAAGPLVYSPFSTIPYANFLIGVPGTRHLGSYIPGVQACWMITPVGCVPIPVLGIMTKVGTNRPF